MFESCGFWSVSDGTLGAVDLWETLERQLDLKALLVRLGGNSSLLGRRDCHVISVSICA